MSIIKSEGPNHRVKVTDLKQGLDRLVKTLKYRDIGQLVEKLAGTSEGYQEVWGRICETLKARKETIIAGLASDPDVDEASVDEVLHYIEDIRADCRVKLMGMGYSIHSPHDRAILRAYHIARGDSKHTGEVSKGEIKAWLQTLYDTSEGLSGNVLDELLRLLAQEKKKDVREYLVTHLRAMDRCDAARFLRQRGVKTHNVAAAKRRGVFISGDRLQGTKARRERTEQYCALSPKEREEQRIQLSNKRNFPYAGRRKGIADAEEHFPYFTSLYAANLARRLDREGRKWLYRHEAMLVPVPGETVSRNLLFEAEFYLPDEDVHMVIVKDRRQEGPGGEKERKEWLHLVRTQRPDLKIQTVAAAELRNAEESESSPVRLDGHTRHAPGFNIQTQPEQFLLEECPCVNCQKEKT